MPEVPFGLSFDENDDGYVLRRKEPDGRIVAITMSPEELAGLRTTVALWMDRRIANAQVAPGTVRAIVSHLIARIRLLPDAIQANVLMTVEAPSGEAMTLSVPLDMADHLATEIPEILAEMRKQGPSERQ